VLPCGLELHLELVLENFDACFPLVDEAPEHGGIFVLQVGDVHLEEVAFSLDVQPVVVAHDFHARVRAHLPATRLCPEQAVVGGPDAERDGGVGVVLDEDAVGAPFTGFEYQPFFLSSNVTNSTWKLYL